ncbi:MAG: hypothetical protein ACR2RB_02740 [Gammaproteobacteria bacterium]
MKSLLWLAALLILAVSVASAQQQGGPEELDARGMSVFGNRELPLSLVIVPWKRAQPGDASRPLESLLDQALEPVDRDVHRRELNYYYGGAE